MTIDSDLRTISRLQADLVNLHRKDAEQAAKVADYTRRMHAASAQATRASSPSVAQSRVRDAERFARDLERAQNQRASLAKSIGQKTAEIARIQQLLTAKQKTAAKKALESDRAIRSQQDARIRELEERALPSIGMAALTGKTVTKPHDVFISHAWEDKEGFVRALAEKCREAGIDAWYDEYSLKWGDSLRQAIDRGLSGAYFGVVVLSENFFKKEWTNYELDGLLQKESSGRGAVLPIWYKVTKDEVEAFSPSLANRLALNTANVTIDEIVQELATRVGELRPKSHEPE